MERGDLYILALKCLTPNCQEMDRRRERNDLTQRKMKSTFCSTDILSKMFGTSYQEGEGYTEGDRHILANPFPQEGEGHRAL